MSGWISSVGWWLIVIAVVILFLEALGLLLYWRRRALRPAPISDGPIAPPLLIEPSHRYDVVIPLSPDFRFVHEPITFRDGFAEKNEAMKHRFVGRERELREFIHHILLSDGGAFLVTGYRGVGKTSFVNRVIQEIKDNRSWLSERLGPFEVLDIHLNLARPMTAGELMHHLIRSLYFQLTEKEILSLLDDDVQESLILAYRRTSMSLNRTVEQSSERSYGLKELTLGLQSLGLGLAPIVTASAKRGKKEGLETSFLDYDEKAAEYDLILLSGKMLQGYTPRAGFAERLWRRTRREEPERIRLKIIYVFDELDKLENYQPDDGKPVIDEMLNNLKNLFTVSGMTFVFVAGKDLQERWAEETSRGDSVYESVFAFNKYLPAMWADVENICVNFIDYDPYLSMPAPRPLSDTAAEYSAPPEPSVFDTFPTTSGTAPPAPPPYGEVRAPTPSYSPRLLMDTATLTPSSYTAPSLPPSYLSTFRDFEKFTAFKGRGMPRRILRTFNQYVKWDGVRPFLAFDKQRLRYIRFFANLQGAIEQEEGRLLGHIREDVPGERRDKRRLGVYYLIDWILARGDSPFSLKEAMAASRALNIKIAPAESSAKEAVETLIEALLDRDYLEKVKFDPAQVIVGDAAEVAETRYCLPKRRILEMGSLSDLLEEEMPEVSFAPEYLTTTTEAGALIQNYSLDYLIATGGNAKIYHGWDLENAREVAVKILQGPHRPYLIDKFEQEGRLLTRLQHPNIIKAYAYGVDNDRLFIAMQYINGPNLSEIIATQGKLELAYTLSILRPLLDALSYLHAQEIVHRDLKPSNIMFDTLGQLYLMDFGISRVASSDTLTATGVIVGTPFYMPPEQVQGLPLDQRADIYALGVMLYEMLTGRVPFQSDNGSPVAVISAHLHEKPVPPRQREPSIPQAVDALIMKCLEKDPGARFQSVEELSAALPHLAPVDIAPLVGSVIGDLKAYLEREAEDTRIPDSAPLRAAVPAAPPPQPIYREAAPAKAATTATALPSLEGISSGPVLVMYPGTGTMQVIPLSSTDRLTIGRSADNEVVLGSAEASRYHATIVARESRFILEDLNTLNGTLVNGDRVHKHVLEDMDEIQIGDVRFVFSGVADNSMFSTRATLGS